MPYGSIHKNPCKGKLREKRSIENKIKNKKPCNRNGYRVFTYGGEKGIRTVPWHIMVINCFCFSRFPSIFRTFLTIFINGWKLVNAFQWENSRETLCAYSTINNRNVSTASSHCCRQFLEQVFPPDIAGQELHGCVRQARFLLHRLFCLFVCHFFRLPVIIKHGEKILP